MSDREVTEAEARRGLVALAGLALAAAALVLAWWWADGRRSTSLRQQFGTATAAAASASEPSKPATATPSEVPGYMAPDDTEETLTSGDVPPASGYPAAPSPTPNPTWAPTDAERRLTRERYGFSVVVPEGWYVHDFKSGVSLTSYDWSQVTSAHDPPTDWAKIEIYATAVDPSLSLDNWLDDQLAGEPMCPEEIAVVQREPWTLLGGKTALRYTTRCVETDMPSLAVRSTDRVVHMHGYGTVDNFEEVARSLRVAPPE